MLYVTIIVVKVNHRDFVLGDYLHCTIVGAPKTPTVKNAKEKNTF